VLRAEQGEMCLDELKSLSDRGMEIMKNGMQIFSRHIGCVSYNLVLNSSRREAREESENHHAGHKHDGDSVQDFQTECAHHFS